MLNTGRKFNFLKAYFKKPKQLSLKIAITLFLSLIVIQSIFLIPSYYGLEIKELNNLEYIAKSIIQTANLTDQASLAQTLSNLNKKTIIKGISILDTNGNQIIHSGEKILFPMNRLDRAAQWFTPLRTDHDNRYDIALTADELKLPFDVKARLDSTKVNAILNQAKLKNILSLFFYAFLYTILSFFIFKYFVLKTIYRLRKHLVQESDDSKHPELYLMLDSGKDELGQILTKFNELLRRVGGFQKTIHAYQAIQDMSTEERHAIFSQITNYNNITGLPNRNLLVDKLTDFISQASFENKRAVLMVIELRDLHEITNTLGMDTANLFLKEAAKILKNNTPSDGMVGHIKSTRFTFSRNNIVGMNQVLTLAQSILDLFSNPFVIANQNLLTRINIGIATFPDDGQDAEALLTNANLAVDKAKMEGPNTYRFHEAAMNETLRTRWSLLIDLHYALEKNQFQLYYQPQINLKDNQLIGFEALLRWEHHEKGFIPPSTFIPLAEEAGIIIQIGEWVLNTACQQIVTWQKADLDHLYVAVNLSSIQFKQKNIVEIVHRALIDSSLIPECLELEITESGIMGNLEESIITMKLLHGLGINISIDDFGTGYSSLSYLKRFPIQKLKIDQSFVRDINVQAEEKSLVEIIIALGHALNLKVIAEGAETKEQVNYLKEKGCDQVQGYYFEKPMSVSDCEKYIKNRT